MKKVKKMDIIKTAIAAIISGVLAYLEPLSNAMVVLTMAFTIDIFFGVICGVTVHNERFHFRKFIRAVAYLLIYLMVIAFVFVVGERLGDEDAALFVVKTITYLFIYFYGTNILRNLTALFPTNRSLRALHYLFGLEFTKRMPWLGDFLKKDDKNGTDQ